MATRAQMDGARERVKEEVLRRLAEGELLREVCASPGMPRSTSVSRWAQGDAQFGTRMRQALAMGDWRRRRMFDEGRARAFLARLAAGETMRALLADPATPTRETLRYWRATQGWFEAEVLRLVQVHRAEKQRRIAAKRAVTPFSEAAGDGVLLWVGRGVSIQRLREKDPSLPAAKTVRRWRRAHPQFDHAMRVNLKMGRLARDRARREARLEQACVGIVMGESLASLGGRAGMPSRESLYRWVAADPALAAMVEDACRERRHWYLDQMEEIAERAHAAGTVRGAVAPWKRLKRQLRRLDANRPGKRWRREGG